MSKTTHTNPVTGRTLKAENIDALDQAMRSRRFAEPHWATFQQWKGTGRPVRPGETGIALEGSSGFTWRVFNVAQTEGGAAAARAPAPAVARSPAAPARKVKPSTRAPESKKIIPRAARGAAAAKDKAFTVSVAAVALREALEWTRRAVSTEETRYYLNGVYFAPVNARELQLVATDGHRLHAQSLLCSWQAGAAGPGFIMRVETIRALVKEIGGKPRDVSITINDKMEISAEVHGGKTFKATAIDGTFPDYLRVIPGDRREAFTLQARAALDACDHAIDAAKARDKKATASVALDASGVQAHSLAQPHGYFNAKYLRDVTRIGDQVEVEFAKDKPEGSPCYFAAPKAKRFAVLMPMRAPEQPAPEPAAPHAAPVDVPQEQPEQPAPAPAPEPQAPAAPVSFRERWMAKFGKRFT